MALAVTAFASEESVCHFAVLQQASTLLEGLEQTSETQQTAKDLVQALQRKDILKNKDRVSTRATAD